MKMNWLIRLGLELVAGAVLLWMGAAFTQRIKWLVPYLAGVGAVLLFGGLLLALRHRKAAGIMAEAHESAQTGPPAA